MKLIVITFSLILISCSTTKSLKNQIAQETQKEMETKSPEEVKFKLLNILKDDTSITVQEKKKLEELINTSFSKKQALETLANKKKKVLLKEYLKNSPNTKKIKLIQKNIESIYHQKLDSLTSLFSEMSKIMKLHPKSTTPFFETVIPASLRDGTVRW